MSQEFLAVFGWPSNKKQSNNNKSKLFIILIYYNIITLTILSSRLVIAVSKTPALFCTTRQAASNYNKKAQSIKDMLSMSQPQHQVLLYAQSPLSKKSTLNEISLLTSHLIVTNLNNIKFSLLLNLLPKYINILVFFPVTLKMFE